MNAGGMPGAGMGGMPPGAGGAGAGGVIRLSEEEGAAVARLTELGFDRTDAAQVRWPSVGPYLVLTVPWPFAQPTHSSSKGATATDSCAVRTKRCSLQHAGVRPMNTPTTVCILLPWEGRLNHVLYESNSVKYSRMQRQAFPFGVFFFLQDGSL